MLAMDPLFPTILLAVLVASILVIVRVPARITPLWAWLAAVGFLAAVLAMALSSTATNCPFYPSLGTSLSDATVEPCSGLTDAGLSLATFAGLLLCVAAGRLFVEAQWRNWTRRT